MYAYYAEDLEEDELDYEFAIRGVITRTGESQANKRADLEDLLIEDRTHHVEYRSQVTLEDEQNTFDAKLAEIESELQQQTTRKLFSRLLCLRNRIFRAPYWNPNLRQQYINRVNQIVSIYFAPTNERPTNPNHQQNTNHPQNPNHQLNQNRQHIANQRTYYNDQQMRNEQHNSYIDPNSSRPLNPLAPQFAPSISQATSVQNVITPNNTFLNPNSASSPRLPESDIIPNQNLNNQQTNENFGTRSIRNLDNIQFPQCSTQSIMFQPSQIQSNPAAQALTEELKDFIKQTIRGAFSNYVDELAQFTTPNISMQTGYRPETCNIGINTTEPSNRSRQPPPPATPNAPRVNTTNRGDPDRSEPHFYNNRAGNLPPVPIQNQLDSIQVDNNPLPLNSQFFQNYQGQSNSSQQALNASANQQQPEQPNNYQHNYQQPGPSNNNPRFSNNQLPIFNGPQGNRPQDNQHPSYYHHLRTKIEKWQIVFSGEPRSLTVTEFIRQVSILARTNRVTQEELLQQAYLLFSGEARKWYFTYWEKFTTWNNLIFYLTMNFENPNKDSAIEDEMKERKHKANEKFSTYLNDMERLSQNLSEPMNEKAKLKLILNNTKMSYQRRLALVTITSINDLSYYCQLFDALEPSLFGNVKSQQGIHQIDVEDFDKLTLDENDEEEHEINAVQTSKSYYKNSRNKNNYKSKDQNMKQYSRQQNQGVSNDEENSRLISCWNCKGEGHFAKDCTEPKSAYCYACGEPNVNKKNCPNQHICELQSKNEN